MLKGHTAHTTALSSHDAQLEEHVEAPFSGGKASHRETVTDLLAARGLIEASREKPQQFPTGLR